MWVRKYRGARELPCNFEEIFIENIQEILGE
jgi:hypothetical protein